MEQSENGAIQSGIHYRLRPAGFLVFAVALLGLGWWLSKHFLMSKGEVVPPFGQIEVPKDLAPSVIYAVPGQELSVYFENLGFFENRDDMRILVRFSRPGGRLERRRWVWKPGEADIGEHSLLIDISKFDEINSSFRSDLDVRLYEIPIVVVPIAATSREMRMLIVGDSITRQMHWPNMLARDLKTGSGVDLSMIGRVEWGSDDASTLGMGRYRDEEGEIRDSPDFVHEITQYRVASDEGVRVEAYNGWTTGSYLQRYFTYAPAANVESDVSRSPFWWPDALESPESKSDEILSYTWDEETGQPVEPGQLSFKRYIDAYADGEGPDVVLIMLGTNDAYFVDALSAGEDKIRKFADEYVDRLEELVKLFRELNPEVPVLIISPPPVSTSASAYQQNFGVRSSMAPTSSKLSLHYHFEALQQRLEGREKENLFYIPAYVGMDPLDGYMPSQLVHPSESGHRQLADQIYAFMVDWMRKRS